MATLRDHIDRIHEEIPIVRLLADLGYDVRPDGDYREQQFSCDLHGDGRDSKPSARAYPDSGSWYCFACDAARDAIDTIRAREDLSFPAAIRWLEKEYDLPPLPWEDEQPKVEQPKPQVYVGEKPLTEVLQILAAELGQMTTDRTIPMDTLLGFWEAGDKVGYQVGQGAMNEATGIQVIRALLGRLDRTWQEGPGD
jgi:DNA primase